MVAVDVVKDTGWWDGAIIELGDLQRLFAETTREVVGSYATVNGMRPDAFFPSRDALYFRRAAQSFHENQVSVWGDWSW